MVAKPALRKATLYRSQTPWEQELMKILPHLKPKSTITKKAMLLHMAWKLAFTESVTTYSTLGLNW
jgi:hypothetical protein